METLHDNLYQIISFDHKRKMRTIWMTFSPLDWPSVKAYFSKSIHPENYYVVELSTGKIARFSDAVKHE